MPSHFRSGARARVLRMVLLGTAVGTFAWVAWAVIALRQALAEDGPPSW